MRTMSDYNYPMDEWLDGFYKAIDIALGWDAFVYNMTDSKSWRCKWYGIFHKCYDCRYCSDTGINYKTDGSTVKCGRCYHSPVEVYVNSEDLSVCLR